MPMDDLRHPDCRYCNEMEAVMRGKVAEIARLKKQQGTENEISREDLLDPAESARVMAEIAKENPDLFNQIEKTVDRVAKFMDSVRKDT